MTFKEFTDVLAKDLGAEIEIADNACAFSAATKDGERFDVLLQGNDERGMVFMCADLGDIPPEGQETLLRTLLEANDLFMGASGATISVNPATGRIRIQRYDDMDALVRGDAANALAAFTDIAAAWKKLIEDYRASDKAKETPEDESNLSGFRV